MLVYAEQLFLGDRL